MFIMKISNLKSILEGFNDDDEVSVAIKVNDKKDAVITCDVGYDTSESGGLMLEVAVYDADFDE
jgi:PDZ domain-containing secreted protein